MRNIFFALLFGLALIAVGCGSPKQTYEINERLVNLDLVSKKPPNATYVLEPPDVLRIESRLDPTLTRSATLRTDGYITLPLIHDVRVAGLTTDQIREKLESLYSRFYRESPELMVTVEAYKSKFIYLYGEVGKQGSMPYSGYMTVSEALGAAGGFTRRAAITRVRVIRGDPENPEIFHVNLRELIYYGNTNEEVSLAENDIIEVPPNALAWIGYQIDNLLFPFSGIFGMAATVEGVKTIGDTTD